ncbi:MAG: ABC transporter permease subunit [Candidatus Bathyarchaeia archaeon]
MAELELRLAVSPLTRRRLTALVAVSSSLIAFAVLILLPTIYLVSFIFTNFPRIYSEIFAHEIVGLENWIQIKRVLFLSLRVSSLTVALDLLFGIPLAYILAKKRFPGRALLEDVVTFPLVLPTSAFGFATLMAWTTITGLGGFLGLGRGLIDVTLRIPFLRVPVLILMVHVALTLPYVALTLRAKIMEVEPMYEEASRTLGAPPLTTFRRVLLPMITPGVLSGAVLAFARSLGETGATLVVSGVYSTASIAVVRWVYEFKFAEAAFLGGLLIAMAWGIIIPVEAIVGRPAGLPMFRPGKLEVKTHGGLVRFEKFASRRLLPLREIAVSAVIGLTIILPVLTVLNALIPYWSADPYTGRVEGGILYQLFGPPNYFREVARATLTSFTVAGVSTYVSACLAVPLTYLIARNPLGGVIRSLLKVPLVVPTSALGLSMLLLWGPSGLNMVKPGVWLIILTHIVFSVPVIVEPTLAAYERSQIILLEEAARTMGATPYDVLETVSLPLLKRGILAGSILSFTHSLGETGATFIVMGRDITVPTLVVNMVESLAIPAALFTSTYLIILSMAMLLAFKFISG